MNKKLIWYCTLFIVFTQIVCMQIIVRWLMLIDKIPILPEQKYSFIGFMTLALIFSTLSFIEFKRKEEGK